ncbi:MAG: hypothetical protein FWD47_11595 [Treponema sp.]|nr:hypothetical protein [Treponema sp.]
MKNAIKLFGIIAIVAVIGFTMTGCPGGPEPETLQGTWSFSGKTLTFSGSTFLEKNQPNLWYDGNFSSTSTQITFNFLRQSTNQGVSWGTSTATDVVNYTLSGNTLTISGSSEGLNGTWTK